MGDLSIIYNHCREKITEKSKWLLTNQKFLDIIRLSFDSNPVYSESALNSYPKIFDSFFVIKLAVVWVSIFCNEDRRVVVFHFNPVNQFSNTPWHHLKHNDNSKKYEHLEYGWLYGTRIRPERFCII